MSGGRPREACGVVAVSGHPEAPQLVAEGLVALQHRGQESAGVAYRSRGGPIRLERGMGLVLEVFPGLVVPGEGSFAVGHVRYSTAGTSDLANAQPLLARTHLGPVALAHNGNLVESAPVAAAPPGPDASDTALVLAAVAESRAPSLEKALESVLAQARGGFAMAALGPDRLWAVRDPRGIRPLVLGRLEGGWALASETCALDAMGARTIRELEPGEFMTIEDGAAPRSRRLFPREAAAPCIFEAVYFARPDSLVAGSTVHALRRRMGGELAAEHPVDADVVLAVPDSSVSAAEGYAAALNLPLEQGLIRNRYLGRAFLEPDPLRRDARVRRKLAVIPSAVAGRRVVLVDDSIVRGTTARHLIGRMWEAGAREVHLRIAAPPYRHPCHYGVDTSRAQRLFAGERPDPSALARELLATSLGYLSLEGLVRAMGGGSHCTACFSGQYPVPVGVMAGATLA